MTCRGMTKTTAADIIKPRTNFHVTLVACFFARFKNRNYCIIAGDKIAHAFIIIRITFAEHSFTMEII